MAVAAPAMAQSAAEIVRSISKPAPAVCADGQPADELGCPNQSGNNAQVHAGLAPGVFTKAPARTRTHASRRYVASYMARPRAADMAVSFELGSATLTPSAERRLADFAGALNASEYATYHYEIAGHTDSVGPRDANLALSAARARSVMTWLSGHGVAADRLVVNGYGPDRPIPGTRASNPANRRVEIALAR